MSQREENLEEYEALAEEQKSRIINLCEQLRCQRETIAAMERNFNWMVFSLGALATFFIFAFLMR